MKSHHRKKTTKRKTQEPLPIKRTWWPLALPLLSLIGAMIAFMLFYQSPKSLPQAKKVNSTTENQEQEKTEKETKTKVKTASLESRPTTAPQFHSLLRSKHAKPQAFSMPVEDGLPRATLWWGNVPDSVTLARLDSGALSNIRLKDYSGPESCKNCHEEKYEAWSDHSHRWMNAMATTESVKGDFSGNASIKYMGGRGTFYRKDNDYFMRLDRDNRQRTFSINRTLGSRFQQYYIGKLIEGPESEDHNLRKVDHVLPFGYWLDKKLWVPVVNVDGEAPDEERFDPFTIGSQMAYDRKCSHCHTTRPVGDLLMWPDTMRRFDAYSPRMLDFFAEGYLSENHPDLIKHLSAYPELSFQQMTETFGKVMNLPAEDHSIVLGISCEACHNGCKEHAEDPKVPPLFFPAGTHVHLQGTSHQFTWGRTSHNLNWTCSRCHAGSRPLYAAGMATWNSTEYSDAVRGSCYSSAKADSRGMNHLTCIHCHEPHSAIGKRWTPTPAEDDAKCMQCHTKFLTKENLQAHTHHSTDSTGSRCMNCHMPRINEGMQDVVRTHTIFSPTEPKMITANQPNACNLCHLDKPIDWTIGHLKSWYDWQEPKDLENKLAANYPHRKQPVGLGWLKSPHHGTRLVAAATLAKTDSHWALSGILDTLDDPFLLNRQFAADGLEEMLNINLQDFRYFFYMMKEERRGPLEKIRHNLLKQSISSESISLP